MTEDGHPPARARASFLEQTQPFALDGSILDQDSVPLFDAVERRVWWIAERLAGGYWHRDDMPKAAEVWGLSPSRVEDYVKMAGIFLRLVTNDISSLRVMNALKMQAIASDETLEKVPGGVAARVKALENMMRLTGDLKGGREQPSMTESERDERIIASLRDPDPHTERLLRAALSEPGEGLVRVLAEFGFGVVNAEGEETEL